MGETVAEKLNLISIRDGAETDLPFIMSTWLKGLRYGNSLFGMVPSNIYYTNYHNIIEKLLSRATVKIACLKDDPDVILGYTVFRGETIDWIFIKKAWRSIGLAKMLLPEKVKWASHVTTLAISYLSKHKEIEFNPFA